MAIFNLSVSTISRSQGRTATAAAAYRAGVLIECQRTGICHDYRRKRGVAHRMIFSPGNAPKWSCRRADLWNAVEAKENRRNSVVAREWRISLPHELDAEQRIEATQAFAKELVKRYGVAADIAIHNPGREGDDRNYHAHILTTTRRLDAEGFAEKTRVLDAAKTGGPEIEIMRKTWAEIANNALERAGKSERIDHRSLEVQREEAEKAAAKARARGDMETAHEQQARSDALNRAPEPKMGPALTGIERRADGELHMAGLPYAPVTKRGAEVAERRIERALLQKLGKQIAEKLAELRAAQPLSAPDAGLLAKGDESRAKEEAAAASKDAQAFDAAAFQAGVNAALDACPGEEGLQTRYNRGVVMLNVDRAKGFLESLRERWRDWHTRDRYRNMPLWSPPPEFEWNTKFVMLREEQKTALAASRLLEGAFDMKAVPASGQDSIQSLIAILRETGGGLLGRDAFMREAAEHRLLRWPVVKIERVEWRNGLPVVSGEDFATGEARAARLCSLTEMAELFANRRKFFVDEARLRFARGSHPSLVAMAGRDLAPGKTVQFRGALEHEGETLVRDFIPCDRPQRRSTPTPEPQKPPQPSPQAKPAASSVQQPTKGGFQP